MTAAVYGNFMEFIHAIHEDEWQFASTYEQEEDCLSIL